MGSPSMLRKSNLKILIVTKTRTGGGTENHIAGLVPALRERGLDVQTAYLDDGFWRLHRTLSHNNYDVVHCFLPRPYLMGSIVCALTGHKTIIMSRRSLRSCYQTPLIRWIEKQLHKRTKVLIGNSPAVVDELRQEAPGADIRLIRNAVNGKFLPREKTPTFFIVCTANAFAYKGHADLLKALRMIGPQLPEPWHCILIGRGTARFNGFRLTGLGWRTDVRSWLGIAGVYVQPSHEEGSSNAILEAMAAGVPVIATEVGGNTDAIRHGYNGVLVPPHRPDMLATQIKAAATCREQFAQMARMAQIDVAIRFSFKAMIDQYEALYQEFA